MYMCIDYVTKSGSKKPNIDETYVEKIVKRHFSGITELLKEHQAGLSNEDIQIYVENLDKAFEEEKASAENQAKVMDELSKQTDEIMRKRKLKDLIKSRVLDYADFDERVTEQIIDNCFSDGSFDGLDDRHCIRKVLEILNGQSAECSSSNQGTDTKGLGTETATSKKTTRKSGKATSKRKKTVDPTVLDEFRETVKNKTPEKPFEETIET